MLSLATTPCDEGVVRGGKPSAHKCAERAKPWVLAATIIGSSMAFIDSSVVSVALPAMQADLAMQVRDTQWMVNSYMLMLGALILVGGAAGDRFGRRRIFVMGVTVFTVASIACGMAPNSMVLIAARAVQGVGGALLVPSSLAIISAAFPENERGPAIGTWAGASALTTALGPVLGGWLVDVWSWRVIFFINVPIAIAAVLIAIGRVPESRSESNTAAIDWRGALLAVAGLGAIAYGLTAASNGGWISVAVLGPLLIGTILLATCFWYEGRASAPMMPLGLFRSSTFIGANAITLLLYFALSGALFFVPFNLIQVQGYSATEAGAAFLPFSLIMGTLSRWSGRLIDRYGARTPLIVGPMITAAGFALLARPGIGGSYWSTFFPAMALLGVGMAISVAPLTTAVMRSAGDRHAGVASGINNATARIAGMLAVALLGAIAVGVFGSTLRDRLDRVAVSPDVRQEMEQQVPKLAQAEVPREVTGSQRQELQRALNDSFLQGFRVTSLIGAVLAMLSALCALLFIDPRVVDADSKSR